MSLRHATTVAALLLVAFIGSSALAAAPQPVTLVSLLHEMTDRDAIARLPDPPFTLKHASSYDRASKTPADPKTWFANHDFGQFLRTENHDGRTEWVILDHTGPGAIVRFWAPVSPKHGNETVRFYLDGSATPAIEAKLGDLLRGHAFVKPPLAFEAWEPGSGNAKRNTGGADLYLPIPFGKSCKITVDQKPFYYNIDYRAYAAGTAVETFSMERFKAASDEIAQASKQLSSRSAASRPDPQTPLLPSGRVMKEMPAGPRAITGIRLTIANHTGPDVLRSLVLVMHFDGEQAVWCPVGAFFGNGERWRPVHDWDRAATDDSAMCCDWVMPYQKSAKIEVLNVSGIPVSIGLDVATKPWTWDARSMHFHATWHSESNIPTRPFRDWNYVTLTGSGVYVGDTLTIETTSRPWYGEGDEKIYVDGSTFPDDFGTGTEDYYGYAWGMAEAFSSPFISMPRRDHTGDDWRGVTTTSRLRLLDTIPFTNVLRVEMEIWHWDPHTKVDYNATCFWYGRPGAASIIVPQPAAAAEPVPPEPMMKKK